MYVSIVVAASHVLRLTEVAGCPAKTSKEKKRARGYA
jgi:hypothetical protein